MPARPGGDTTPRPGKTKISIRLDNRVLDHFRNAVAAAGGGSYQGAINAALLAHIERQAMLEAIRRAIREEIGPRQPPPA